MKEVEPSRDPVRPLAAAIQSAQQQVDDALSRSLHTQEQENEAKARHVVATAENVASRARLATARQHVAELEAAFQATKD